MYDSPVKLFVLDFGLFKVHSNGRVIGICGYLIETRTGRRILVDTGFPAKYAYDIAKASEEDNLGDFGEVIALTEANLPAGQLACIGLSPADIDCLVMTHTHIDHVGGIADFPRAPLVIGAEERSLPRPLYWKGGQPLEWPDVETIVVSKDLDLFPGVRLLTTPGHSPGHLSLLVSLPNTGQVLLTADAISRPAEIEGRFAGSWNEEMAIESAERILRIAKSCNAFVIYGHSPEQWPTLRKAPQFYD
ncbi:MBL fold metallo-hydrolase (plasmid) [Mesorhizobium sp. INR15]|nr:MBL fold metallo-hydrolase [Mesorhizobium sp. INR15]